jgi:hypothetical protein
MNSTFGIAFGRNAKSTRLEQAAEQLWSEFVARAGIEYV